MRLKRIKLNSNFRSLHSGFEIDFIENKPDSYSEVNPYCLIGRNGSGKSNLLELLAFIFYNLELRCLEFFPEIFDKMDANYQIPEPSTKKRDETYPKSYELEYYIGKNLIKVIKKDGAEEAIYKNDDLLKSLKDDKDAILPKFIVGYSSGENEILSLPFFKMRFIQYDEYLKYLSDELPYSSPESRMVYLDSEYSQAIFLCNFLFQPEEILDVFQDVLGISETKEFRIVINQRHMHALEHEIQLNAGSETGINELNTYCGELFKLTSDMLTKVGSTDSSKILELVSKIESQAQQTSITDYIELTSSLSQQIKKLRNCATLEYFDNEKGHLVLDFFVDDKLKEAFRFYFKDEYSEPSPLELFKLFQVLLSLNLYQIEDDVKDKIYRSTSLFAKGRASLPHWEDRIFRFKRFMIKKNDSAILSKSLSDGEYQFLHTIGLALLYKNTNSIFLLDEPETHFNPEWRAKYISVLKKCFKGDLQTPEVLITSHSPFIISDTNENNVLIFTKDDNGTTNCVRPDFNTFGASVSKITSKVFGTNSSIGDNSKNELELFKLQLDNNSDLKSLAAEVDEKFGESVEKFIFLKAIHTKLKG